MALLEVYKEFEWPCPLCSWTMKGLRVVEVGWHASNHWAAKHDSAIIRGNVVRRVLRYDLLGSEAHPDERLFEAQEEVGSIPT